MTPLSDAERTWLAELLNRMPFVEWDRMTFSRDRQTGEMLVAVYGWIARDDSRSDFVVVLIEHGIGFTTSSAERSEEIAQLLGLASVHVSCERVEDELPAVEHAAHT